MRLSMLTQIKKIIPICIFRMVNIELTTTTTTTAITNHTTATLATKTKLTIVDNATNKMETCRPRQVGNNPLIDDVQRRR